MISDNSKKEEGIRINSTGKKIKRSEPMISIITVVFNGEHCIEETILSALGQTYNNIEYIVIDGDSTDKTLNIIKKYENNIDYWISEPDKGIYDAMNKSVKYITGDWCHFLNAGDTFVNTQTLKNVSVLLDKKFTLCYGNYYFKYSDQYSKLVQQKGLTKFGIYKTINHQSIFYNVSKIGSEKLYYCNKFKMAADFNLTLVLRQMDKIFYLKKIEEPIAFYQRGGASHQKKIEVLMERKTILQQEEQNEIRLYWNLISLNLKILKTKILKTLIGKVELTDLKFPF